MACFLLRDRSGISATEFTDRDNTASSTLLHLAVPAPSHLPCIYTEALFAAGYGKETILVIGSKCAGGYRSKSERSHPNSCARLEQREFQSTGS
jgi:hypothetical protein